MSKAKIYKLLSFTYCQKCRIFADCTIVVASGYLILKKLFGLSISKWLLDNVLQAGSINVLQWAFGILISAAIVIKVANMIIEHFPINTPINVEPIEISECLQSINLEITSHIKKLETKRPRNVCKLSDQHNFDIHTRAITNALAEHIRKSITSIKVKNKDLFISLYTLHDTDLEYELHFDPRRDLVKTKLIPLDSKRYKNYECIKCIESENSTTYMLNTRGYSKGESKRHKTIKHSMGCKIEANGYIFGFLTIEFHNINIFTTEEEMQDFMETNIFPFKLLLEYQYLKKAFFKTFNSFDQNWRVE